MNSVPNNITMWAGIVGFFLPIAISVITQSGWNDRVKSVIAFICCLIASIGTAYFSGNFAGQDIVTCALIVFTLAIASYVGFWKPSGIAGAIRSVTDVGKGARA